MDIPILLIKTILLRPYVFLFLAVFLYSAQRLLGQAQAWAFFFITWLTAFLCEFSSTRTGFPFGWYFYTGSTVGQELYIFNVPFMDSLSFTFLLYASYCLALLFLLPARTSEQPASSRRPTSRPRSLLGGAVRLIFDPDIRRSQPVLWLTALLYVFIDIVIDPVALRGDRWFLGQLYGYRDPGIYFGVPLANFAGWAVVGLLALSGYFLVDRWLSQPTEESSRTADGRVTRHVLLGCTLYYAVLIFNLAMTFWIGEALLGLTGIFMFLPITALALLRVSGRLALTH